MITYYDKEYNITENEKSAVCCITKTKTGELYHIKSIKTRLYDVTEINSSDLNAKWQFQKVSKEVFDYYTYFLKTGSKKHKLYAERLL